MGLWADTYVASVESGLAEAAVASDIEAMTAYMRHQFRFLGVKSAGQKRAVRDALAAAGPPVDEREVVAAIDALWCRSEREYRYCGCDLMARFAPRASPMIIDRLAGWITTDPWWDTCDSLARHGAGEVVRRHRVVDQGVVGFGSPRLTMDRWLAGDDLWLARAAIIHMGAWKQDIDRDWVFAACVARAEDTEFFIRKAIGWILRDLAWVDAPAVVGFLDGPGAALSNLSKREALLNVNGARTRARLRRTTGDIPER